MDSTATDNGILEALGQVDSECTLDYVGIPGQLSTIKFFRLHLCSFATICYFIIITCFESGTEGIAKYGLLFVKLLNK